MGAISQSIVGLSTCTSGVGWSWLADDAVRSVVVGVRVRVKSRMCRYGR
jgi:fructose-specific phosphotransferase system component IIB